MTIVIGLSKVLKEVYLQQMSDKVEHWETKAKLTLKSIKMLVEEVIGPN